MVHQGGGGERRAFYCVEFGQLAAGIWLICTEHCQQFLLASVLQQDPLTHLTAPILGGDGCLFIDVARPWLVDACTLCR